MMSGTRGTRVIFALALLVIAKRIPAAPMHESVLLAHKHAAQISPLRSEPTPSLGCIAKNCLVQSAECFVDKECRAALGCSTQEHGRFQCINDHENDVYDKLVYCMFNQHDCMGTNSTYDPYQMCKPIGETAPIGTYRGQNLTKDLARHLLMRGTNQRGDWLVAMGKSPAFDCFDCQYFYWGYKPDQTMYYHADYKIHKSNNQTRWQSSEQSANEWNDTAGRYSLIASNDHGLFREDDWRMLAVDELNDLPAWIALYYCGGAPGVANSYEGAMVLTADGEVPTDPKVVTAIEAVFMKANISLECKTDNSNCSDHPEPPSRV